MTYVTSDLHGYPVEKIKEKLTEIGFDEGDRLYILGDCIDRGPDGLKIVLWAMSQTNVTLLLGNHEAMMLENRFLLDGETVPSVLDLKGEQRDSYCIWLSNGGCATLDGMQRLSASQIKDIFGFLENAPLYKEIEVDGKIFILTHSGLGSFDADKPLSEYSKSDLIWARPSLDTRYYEDGKIVVFGHSPTVLFGDEFRGKPIFTETWYNIDVGAGWGMSPVILRLDDNKVFRV